LTAHAIGRQVKPENDKSCWRADMRYTGTSALFSHFKIIDFEKAVMIKN
jgi:hypothetical protein